MKTMQRHESKEKLLKTKTTMKNKEQQGKAMINNVKHWNTMASNKKQQNYENQWKAMKNNEQHGKKENN